MNRLIAASLTCVALALITGPAFAADLVGTWNGSIDSPNGPVQVSFQFKKDAVSVSMGSDPIHFDYTGTLVTEGPKLHTEFMGQGIDFTVKKAS
jgi:hypothetical protein